jgi:NAD(P)-dependent dehydrogenase (short-subunit alcohol dehydrogenase family)
VTGGATGIGYACAVALAGEGCRVAIAGRREDALRQAAQQHRGSPPLVHHPVDVGNRQSVQTLFDWARRELGKVDILVCSAGVNTQRRMLADMPPDTWDQVMQINATGPYNCMLAVLPEMRERRDGLIVNISSVAGKRATLLGGVAYNASKFAVTALGIAAALEEGKNGIRVTTIFPGEVDTPILEVRPVPVDAAHRARILRPEDVAEAVLMVACLPPRAHVSELIIKPVGQDYA